MDPSSSSPIGAEKHHSDPEIGALQQASSRASRVAERAAKIQAMVHQSMQTTTAIASRITHTSVEQSPRGGIVMGTGSQSLPRAESEAEGAAVRVESYTSARGCPSLSTHDTAASIVPDRQSPHVVLLPKPYQIRDRAIPLTPDDSCEESSEKIKSEPLASCFDSEPRNPLMANAPYVSHIPVSASNVNTSSSRKRRPRDQNLIDRIVRESQQPGPEAPLTPKKRGRPRRSAEKLQPGERILSFLAPRNPPGSSFAPTITQPAMFESLPPPRPYPRAQELSYGESIRLEGCSNGATSLEISVTPQSISTSSTISLVSENSATEVRSAIESQTQLAQENNLLKAMFKTEIGPIMDEVMGHYESRLPRDVLMAIGKAFASKILNRKLRQALREGQYVVTSLFKRIAKGTLQRMLIQKLREREKESMDSWANSSANAPSFRSPQEPYQAIEVRDAQRQRPNRVFESTATPVGKGDAWDRPSKAEAFDEAEVRNIGGHSPLDCEYHLASSFETGFPHKPTLKLHQPQGQAPGTYEGCAEEISKTRERQWTVRDVKIRQVNAYSLDGGRSPPPTHEAGFKSAADTTLGEPCEREAPENSTLERSSGGDIPPPQLETASRTVSSLVEAWDTKAEQTVGDDSHRITDTFCLPANKAIGAPHEPKTLNTSTPEHSLVTGLQPFKTTSFFRPSSVSALVGPRSSQAYLDDSNDVDLPLRPKLSSSGVRPFGEANQPEEGLQTRQQFDEITDEMRTRLLRRVDYTEPPLLDPAWEDRSPSSTAHQATDRQICSIRQPCTRKVDSILRNRELGTGKWNFTPYVGIGAMNFALRAHIAQGLGCWRSWTGASKDIVTAAWAPNGRAYAVGASTEMDNLNIQYNRANNLLLGDNDANTLTELPDHYIARPRPETIESGDNALEDTYNAVDPELYTTVSHVCFSHESDRLYSASFDKTVKIWDIAPAKKAKCLQTLRHEANVELLSFSHKPMKLLATGQRTVDDSINLYNIDDYGLENSPTTSTINLKSFRAAKFRLYPTCLVWGPSASTDNFLLAGYSEIKTDESGHDQQGDLCLWDATTMKQLKLSPSAQAVHDITWHPTLPLFAAATVPGSRTNLTSRKTRSVIRTYQPLDGPGRIMEYECPALDINDIRFHPLDDHYLSAGCTDGVTYVWDVRMPEVILHKLRHGEPIDELDHTRSCEEQDTGVRFTAWDRDGLNLHTGSSDGVVKTWNIFVSPEDALVRDVAHFDGGIMTGSFSPDYTNLLVGLSKGSVHVLSTAPLTHDPQEDSYSSDTETPGKAYDPITYVPSKHPVQEELPSGIDISRELVASGQLVMHPTYGPGKGPNYEGPFASYARPEGADPTAVDLAPDILASQLDPSERKRGRRLGGKQDKQARERYREADKVAKARNEPLQFQEGNRQAKKRLYEKGEVWWDVEAEEDDGEEVDVGKGGSGFGGEGLREVKKEKVGAEWEGKVVIAIDDD